VLEGRSSASKTSPMRQAVQTERSSMGAECGTVLRV
jgi:hypothetical protein